MTIREIESLMTVDESFSDWKSAFLNQISRDLSDDQVRKILEILMKNKNAFARKTSELGYVSWKKCPIKIDIGDEPVPFFKPYSCSPAKRLAFEKVCEDLESAGIISQTTANGGAPSLLVTKPDGSHRLVVDY